MEHDASTKVSDTPRIRNPYAGGNGESHIGRMNRDNAVIFALEHAEDTSDQFGFHYFSQETGGVSDCTNYVSRCMFAGGRTMNEEWYWNGLSHDGWRGIVGKMTINASE
jgi:hypothetical protein